MPLEFGNEVKNKPARGFTAFSHKSYPGSDLQITPKPQARSVYWLNTLGWVLLWLFVLAIMALIIGYAINLPVR